MYSQLFPITQLILQILIKLIGANDLLEGSNFEFNSGRYQGDFLVHFHYSSAQLWFSKFKQRN